MRIRIMHQRGIYAVASVLLLLLFAGCSNSNALSGSNRVTNEHEYLPAVDEVVQVDVTAEMTHYETPIYPRLAQQAGLEGSVWIKALVASDGSVRNAVVHQSSGTQSLDEAALRAAHKCQFKPAIRNGRPVAVWVKYEVVFDLDDIW